MNEVSPRAAPCDLKRRTARRRSDSRLGTCVAIVQCAVSVEASSSTGASSGTITSPLGQKRLELILELVPKARTISMLVNPTFPNTEMEVRDVQAAAIANGRELRTFNASTVAEIDGAFAALADQRAEALIVASDPFFSTRPDQFAALAARHGILGIYPFREFVGLGL